MITRMIDEDRFIALFQPKRNPFNDSAGFDFGGGGCLFETYGREWDHVRTADPATVWTIIDGDDGISIESGLHWVNRLGYVLTKRRVQTGSVVSVMLDID